MRNKSKKVQDTEKWVDDYTAKNKVAPTYSEVAKAMKISRTAAYSRCQKFRGKMKVENPDMAVAIKYTRIKLDFVVQNENLQQFSVILSQLNKLLNPNNHE